MTDYEVLYLLREDILLLSEEKKKKERRAYTNWDNILRVYSILKIEWEFAGGDKIYFKRGTPSSEE